MIYVYMLKYQLQTRLACFIFKQRKCKELSFFLNFDKSLHHLFDLVPSPQTKMLAPEHVVCCSGWAPVRLHEIEMNNVIDTQLLEGNDLEDPKIPEVTVSLSRLNLLPNKSRHLHSSLK